MPRPMKTETLPRRTLNVAFSEAAFEQLSNLSTKYSKQLGRQVSVNELVRASVDAFLCQQLGEGY